jgi:hypothetical protein
VKDSIRSAASTIAYGLLKYYTNNATDTPPEKIGLLPFPPYYWWESGAMWAGLIDYHSYTKDGSYVNSTIQALMAQRGPKDDFIVPVHRGDEVRVHMILCPPCLWIISLTYFTIGQRRPSLLGPRSPLSNREQVPRSTS